MRLADRERRSKRSFNLQVYTSLAKDLEKAETGDHCLHLFGTSSLAWTAEQRYGLAARGLDSVKSRLFPLLDSSLTNVYLKSQLRKAIYEKGLNTGLLDRIPDIIQTARVFAEFEQPAVTSEAIPPGREEIIQLVHVLLADEVFAEYREKLMRLTKEDISLLLCGHRRLDTFYVYEIEYMNYFRLKFFHWLRTKGFLIEFRIPYDSRYPETFSFWYQVYSVAARLEVKEQAGDVTGQSARGSRFADFNENLPERSDDPAAVRIIEFSSSSDFQKYFNSQPDVWAAVDPEDIERLVVHERKGLYDDEFGKFVYYLHQCRKKEEDIEMTFNVFIELLTSGWVRTTAVQGEDALSLLVELREYMQGTETFYEIQDRLQRLQELETVSRTMDRENTKDVHSDPMKRYMLNPFRTFSYIQPDRHDVTITQLIDLAGELHKICGELLLAENDSMPVNDYMARWLNALNKAGSRYDISAWQQVFEKKFPETWEFAIEELFELIFLTADSQYEKMAPLLSEDRVQEFILTGDTNKPLHITNFTFTNFPVSHHTELSPFFSYGELKNLVKSSVANETELPSVLFHSLWTDFEVRKNFESLGIYRIYHMLNSFGGNILFSWVKELHEESIRNVYLDILADLYQEGAIEEYRHTEEMMAAFSGDTQFANEEPVSNISKLKGKIPDLYWLDHDFCSKKFYLTSIVERQPVYRSEFHQQFVFSKIGKLFSQSPADRHEFRELIYPLFPHWTYSKKENLIDMEYKTAFRSYKHFENISYPKEMKSIQILRSVYRENRRTKARSQYRLKSDSKEKDLIKQFQLNAGKYEVKAEPGNHCKMCPHLASCTEGRYSIESFT